MYNFEKEFKRYVQEIGGRIISSNNPSRDIRETRINLGITQADMGALMNLRRETISRIENGYITPTFEFVKKFSRTIAAAKIIRDLQALEEVSFIKGKRPMVITPTLLRLYLKMPLEDLKLISDIGIKGYQKSRNRIIKEIRGEKTVPVTRLKGRMH
jgi:DNA-binding XRE family transcriptional regulator